MTSPDTSSSEEAFTDKGKFLSKYAPSGDESYLLGAWLGCLRWAMTTQEITDRFKKDTGFNWTPGNSPIDRIIDESCGMQEKYFEEFARWMNENIWGEV